MGLKIRPTVVSSAAAALYHILGQCGAAAVGRMQMKEGRGKREREREHNLKELCSLPDWWGLLKRTSGGTHFQVQQDSKLITCRNNTNGPCFIATYPLDRAGSELGLADFVYRVTNKFNKFDGEPCP